MSRLPENHASIGLRPQSVGRLFAARTRDLNSPCLDLSRKLSTESKTHFPPMCSGRGQFHTNEADPEKPSKKLTPYDEIDLEGIRRLVDAPPQVEKANGQWFIPSTLKSRKFDKQESEGEYRMLWADIDTELLNTSCDEQIRTRF